MTQTEAQIRNIYDNQWLSLREVIWPDKGVNGYVYSHESRCKGHIIAVMPYRIKDDNRPEFLLRAEVTPCWSMEKQLSAITGGCEFEGDEPSIDDITKDVLRELVEEAGYAVHPDTLEALGVCRGTKSCDTMYHLYAVDVDGVEQGRLTGDGSQLEEEASVIWVAWPSDSHDPLVSTMYARLLIVLSGGSMPPLNPRP